MAERRARCKGRDAVGVCASPATAGRSTCIARAIELLLPREVVWRREKMGFPFALRPFLARHAARLAPLVAEVAAAGIVPQTAAFDTMLSAAPHRLWRICSIGLWLRVLPALGLQQPLASTTLRAT